MIDVSIIIVSYNTKKLLLECLASIKRYTKEITYEVIVVDNASTDGTIEKLKNSKTQKLKFQLIENKENRGFAAANNQGIKKARGRYILLLNPDTKLVENSLLKMVLWMDKYPKVGISTCKLVNPDGSLQPTGGFFPKLSRIILWSTFLDDLPLVGDLFGSYHPHPQSLVYRNEGPLDWVTGAFFLIRDEVIEDVGRLDEDFFLYVEEVDYCWRSKKRGWQVWYVPTTRVLHYSGASGTKEGTILREFEGLKLLYQRHFPSWQGILLRIFLFIAILARMVVFAIIKPKRSKIYAHILAKI